MNSFDKFYLLCHRRFLSAVCCIGCIALAGLGSAHANIFTSGNFQTGTPTPSLSISSPFTFNITATGDFQGIVLDGWVTSDGSENEALASPTTQTLSFEINGGPVQTVLFDGLIDNRASTFDNFSPNDGELALARSVPLSAGQTLTILAQSFTFRSDANFNPAVPAAFSGTAIAISNADIRLSAPTAVPEPGTWAFLLLGATSATICTVRRRSRAQLTV